ncbi:MAG: hypothetical protein ACTSWX_07970 [Promethearchaeota archaeon]
MKKLLLGLLVIVVCIGFFQIMRSISYAGDANCYGGYECGHPGDVGASCGTTPALCECVHKIFIGTVCQEKNLPI